MRHMVPRCSPPSLLLFWFIAATSALPSDALSQPGFWQSLAGPEGGVVQCFTTDAQGNILAGTYLGGLYKTTDRAGSWSHVGETAWDTRAILVAPGGTMFVGAAASGVWKSTDAGETWNRPVNILNGRTVTSLALTRSGNLIAGCASTSSQSVYRSTDNGESFHLVSALVLSANGLAPERGDTLFCAGERFGIILSTDAGASWTRINPSPSNFDGLAVASNAGYLFLVGRRNPATTPDSSFIYRRRHTTGLWELVRIQSGVVLRTVAVLGDTVMASGGLTVLVSFDAGQTWIDRSSAASKGAVPLPKPAISSFVARDVQLLGTAGRGAARTTDFMQSWTPSLRGMINTHVVAGTVLGPNRSLVSTQFDGLFLIDGTAITRTGAGLPANDVVTALAANDVVVLAGTANNGIYRSFDRGANFTQALYGMNASGILNITTSRESTFWAGGKGEYLHRTSNNAATWSSNRLPFSVVTNITSIKATASGGVYAATGSFEGSGSGNGVYFTADSGRTWSQRGLAFTTVRSLDLYADSILLAGTATAQVYEGRASSTQWNLTPPFPAGGRLHFAQFYSYASYPLKQVAGVDKSWYQREAQSPVWDLLVFPPYEPTHVSPTPPSSYGGPSVVPGGLDVGTYGGGMYRSTGPLTWVRSGPETAPQGFLLEQNYPNPFNPSTTIRYGLSQRSHVTLKVYNTLGQVVATLVTGEKEAGYYEAGFDASGLASGVYLYRLAAGELLETKKLMVVK